MYVYVCVCVCMYACVYVCASCIYAHVCISVYVFQHVWIYARQSQPDPVASDESFGKDETGHDSLVELFLPFGLRI